MTDRANQISTNDPVAAAKTWFARLSANCAAVDYDSTMDIFAEDVVAFGTKMDIVSGLDNLRKNQWEGIWPNIRDFKVELDSVHAGGDAAHAWGVATWTSTGFHESGESYFRPGRATVTLEKRGGAWLATHTHFSLFPGTPQRTFGPK